MKRYGLTLLMILLTWTSTEAQVRQFPYEARVVAEQTYARSGGGDAFYPTISLPVGTTVRVHRHDPGGWYMIDPPESSFSWVPEKFVKRISVDEGEVIEGDAVVFVGSAFGDETSVWQRKLLAGEKVRILGEKQVDTLSGLKAMLKIAPPAREYRWVQGTAVVPVAEAARMQRDQDPYAVPSHLVQRSPSPVDGESGVTTLPAPGPEQQRDANGKAASQSPYSPSQQMVRLQQIRQEQRDLQLLDQRFRSMILSDPSGWDLQEMETAYQELQQRANYKPVAAQIDLRYPAIQRYRQRKAEYDDLKRLTSQTERRDAELLAQQFGLPVSEPPTTFPTDPALISPPEGSLVPSPVVFDGAQSPLMIADSGLQMTPPVSTETGILLSGGVADGKTASQIPANSPYVGAGIVRRTQTQDAEKYVLMSPGGKVLATLRAESADVNLAEQVGKSVGLQGKRWFDDAAGTDVIEVSGLEAVRLR